MSGPPKTPSHLRLVRGNPSKRPINKKEPKPPSGVPPTPKHFTKQGKYWFKRIGEELDAMGVMSSMDAKALELLIETAPNHIAELYRKWAAAGHLELTDGEVIDHDIIKADILAWCEGDDLRELGFDPWSAVQFSRRLAEEGIPLVEVAQTVKNMSESMKTVQADVYSGKFHHDHNPMMSWMMSNVTVKPDKNDNIFPNKSTPENKIDGPVALFTAKSRQMVNGGEDKQDLSGFFENPIMVGI